MKAKTSVTRNRFNIIVVGCIFFASGIYSGPVQAQSFKPFKYIGLEGTFGVRSFKIDSSIPEVSGMHVVVEGGSAGLSFGNDILKTKIRAAGFYYSAASVPRTVDLFESEVLFNFYPLEYFRQNENTLDVYVIAGVSMDNVKFFGHYIAADKDKVNYSTSKEPYLGRLNQTNITGGLGLEYKLWFNGDFVNLFAEAKYGSVFRSSTDRACFETTSIKNFASISAGVSFGLCRNVTQP